MKFYKVISLVLFIIFAIAGLIFLFFPNLLLQVFNYFSFYTGNPKTPLNGANIYLALASSYMYLITLFTFLMFRNPAQKIYALLLSHAKFVTSLVSLWLFIMHQHYLIYITNFFFDGALALLALYLWKKKIAVSE